MSPRRGQAASSIVASGCSFRKLESKRPATRAASKLLRKLPRRSDGRDHVSALDHLPEDPVRVALRGRRDSSPGAERLLKSKSASSSWHDPIAARPLSFRSTAGVRRWSLSNSMRESRQEIAVLDGLRNRPYELRSVSSHARHAARGNLRDAASALGRNDRARLRDMPGGREDRRGV